jgi:DNA transposition AAA+ family ATPase
MQYAQLYSRVGLAMQLDVLEADDVREIVGAAIPHSNGVWTEFQAASKGNARILSKLIQNSRRVAKLNQTEITPEIVRETAKMLLI